MVSKKKRAPNDGELLTLESVTALGGNKADLELLKDVENDDNEEFELDKDKDLESEPIKIDELRQFINTLGIKQHREGGKQQDEKKKTKKLAEMPQTEDDTQPDTSSQPPLESKKKQRNKYKALVQHSEVSSTTPTTDHTLNFSSHVANYKPRTFFLVRPGQQWRDAEVVVTETANSNLERQMEQFASKLLQDEVAVYNKSRESNKKSESTWIKTVLSSGTLVDKIAALTLLVQESPIHNLGSLESLVNMAKKKGKRECMMAADTLKEVFGTYLLPEDAKLRCFNQFDLANICKAVSGNRDALDRRLIQWYYESELKKTYSNFIQALDTMSHDTLLATKQKALSVIHELLAQKPEQEKTLLAMIVNKVGDPDHKLATKASHYLTKLVERHPNMKTVVVEEVERLIYRPNIPKKAQYYCICFLNQLLLNHEEKALAIKLVTVYFSFFKAFVKRGEVDSKIMSALLSGVNRAYPYAKVKEDLINAQMDTLYKIVHVVNFNTSIQALMLLYQVLDSSKSVSDRFYMALYRKLGDPALKSSGKHSLFLNLLFKSIRKDVSERRIKAFMKRLLQICQYQPPQFICGSLVLMGELMKSNMNLLLTKHTAQDCEDSDEEEHFIDLPAPEDSENLDSSVSHESSADEGNVTKPQVKSSWIHKSMVKGGSGYDPNHRNPLYCRAEQECVWELKKLTNHFHPSVSLFAQNLLQGKPIYYGGDPLQDFTTIRFLDRFVYKNPKKQDKIPDNAFMLSKAKCRSNKPMKAVKTIPINSEKYISKSEGDIPVEEKFFFKYFTQRAQLSKKGKQEVEEEEEDSDVSDTEFDAYLDDYEANFDEDGLRKMDFSGLDFAGEMGKAANKRFGIDEDEDESEDDLDALSDEEASFGDDDDFGDAFKEFDDDIYSAGQDGDEDDDAFDEEDMSFSEDDELAELQPKQSSKKGKKRKAGQTDTLSTKKHKKSSDGLGSVFASAEEFSHLIDNESTAGYKLDTTGSEAMSNKDNAHVKQLKWEMERDRKMKKGNWHSKSSRKKDSKGTVKSKQKNKSQSGQRIERKNNKKAFGKKRYSKNK